MLPMKRATRHSAAGLLLLLFLIVLSLVGSGTAMPVNQTAEPPTGDVLLKRYPPKLPTPPGGSCCWHEFGVTHHYNVRLPNRTWDEHCELGVLDNLRGECGIITEWQCIWRELYGVRRTADIGFYTDIGCQPSEVITAVRKATHGQFDFICPKTDKC